MTIASDPHSRPSQRSFFERPERRGDKVCCLSPREFELWKQNIVPNCSHHSHVSSEIATEMVKAPEHGAKFVGPRQIQVVYHDSDRKWARPEKSYSCPICFKTCSALGGCHKCGGPGRSFLRLTPLRSL